MQLHVLFKKKLVRFLLVGGINTLFSYAIYALLLYFGLQYALANFLAMLSGIFFSFQTQGRLVFQNSDQRLIWRYALFWFVLYLCNIVLIKLMLVGGVDAYSAGALAFPVIVVLSFFMQKMLVFRVRSS
jgi:putative flippase GtrA